jgi:hypothetical protein
MGKKKTHEEFVEQLNKIHREGTYMPLEKYDGINTKLLVRHNQCGYEWNIIPKNLLKGQGCPKCFGNIKKTTEDFKKEIYELYGNEYKILGEYKGAKTKILVKHNCKECNYHEWAIEPTSLLNGNGCPVCSGREVKLGVNTIWDTDRWMCNLGVSEEDAKKYSKGSNKKITVKCPNCDREKEMQINSIYKRKSISCSCGDGKSYPEKFVFNLLEQLDVDFETEYKPSWIDNKRYDFHIKGINCIIETHGEQHYKEKIFSRCGRGLTKEQINDKYKKEMALSNEIKYYIELDCRKSEMDYIKNSILNSELNDLFDLSNIDWNKCAEFANKNIIKEVCECWNNRKDSETTVDVGRIFKLSKSSIIDYLKNGTKLGWCNYNPKEEMKKIGYNCGKKVEIFKDGQSLGIFSSCAELERQSKKLFGVRLFNQCISDICNGKQKHHKGFTFKYVR